MSDESIFPPFNVKVPLPAGTKPPMPDAPAPETEDATKPWAPGYHLREIARGVYGEASKIREEADEFADATEQQASIMALVELSDLYGAIRGYLAKNHPSITMDELARMSEITERAFVNGQR